MKTIKELRLETNLSQQKFGDRFGIPLRTIQNWEYGTRKPPEYVITMIETILGLEAEILKNTAKGK